MRNYFLFAFVAVFLCLLSQSYLNPAPAIAADGAEKSEETQKDDDGKLSPGVIASQGVVRSRSGSVGNAYSASISSKKVPPISATINQLGKGRCEVVLSNTNKEKAISARYKVVGTRNSNGSTVFTRHFSNRIRAEGTTTRKIDCPKGVGLQVVLKAGKEL